MDCFHETDSMVYSVTRFLTLLSLYHKIIRWREREDMSKFIFEINQLIFDLKTLMKLSISTQI